MPAFPASMSAVFAELPGGPEALQIRQVPLTQSASGEVLIKVAAAGINRPDLLQRQGKYNPPAGITSILGLEVAGTVQNDGQRWKKGDKVCALVAGGGYADYVAAPEGQCLPWPENLSAAEAAALPEAVFTVWANVFRAGQLKAGETVLVHGGSSGIGTTAIQMIKAAGAEALVTVGSAEKAEACMKLGAVLAVSYRAEDFTKAVMDHTHGAGVDIVLDMIGGDYVSRNLSVLAIQGRHISIATQQGAEASINLRQMMNKRLILTGSTLRPRSIAEKTALAQEIERTVWPWVAAGRLKPHIFQVFPLKKVADAHKVMESGVHIGKMVLILDA